MLLGYSCNTNQQVSLKQKVNAEATITCLIHPPISMSSNFISTHQRESYESPKGQVATVEALSARQVENDVETNEGRKKKKDLWSRL